MFTRFRQRGSPNATESARSRVVVRFFARFQGSVAFQRAADGITETPNDSGESDIGERRRETRRNGLSVRRDRSPECARLLFSVLRLCGPREEDKEKDSRAEREKE